MSIRTHLTLPLLAAAPCLLLASTPGPPPQRTGAAVDGGLTCTACHRDATLNSDPRGRLTIDARDYRPGRKQIIRVILEHTEAMKWGFQLTARKVSDPASQAGTFTMTSAIRVRCAGTAPDGNCAGAQEFASHNPTSTYTGQRNRAVWEVEWTAPPAGTGDVVFYAAGNAANNNGANTGDTIYNVSRQISAEACNLTGPAQVTAVRNGASFADGPVAMNTLISIGGSGFYVAGAGRTVERTDIENNRFPTELGCVAVEIAGRRSPVTFVSQTQINAQVPTVGDLGPVPLRVILNPGLPNEVRSEPFTIQLGESSPAFFRLLPTPLIAARFPDGRVAGNPAQVPGTVAPKPGEEIVLYATGLSDTEPIWQAGEIPTGAAPVKEAVAVEWNGTVLPASEVRYVGLSPSSISGLYQINVRVPANARTSAANSVRIRQGNRISPEGTEIYVGSN